MKSKYLLTALLLALAPGLCHATTVTLIGVVMNPVTQAPLQGKACFNLPISAVDTSTSKSLTTAQYCFRLLNGTFPAFAKVVPNDVMQPTNLYYQVQYLDLNGQQVSAANYVIPTGGGTFNVGLAIPTNVTTSNISFLSPACLTCNNVFTGLNTFTQQVTLSVATGTPPLLVSSTTVVPNLNVQTITGCVVSNTPVNGQQLQASGPAACSWITPPNINAYKLECVNVTSVTVANSAALTPLQNCTIPANDIGSAQTFYVEGFGTVSDVGPPTLTMCLYLDAVSLGCPSIPLKVVTGSTWSYRGFITGLTTGAGGTVAGAQANFSYAVAQTPNSGVNSSVCSTGASSTCSTAVNLAYTEPDTNYAASATCVSPTQFPFILGVSKSTTQVTVTLTPGTASQAQVSTCSELDVTATRPPAMVTATTAVPTGATVDTTVSHSMRLQIQWGTAAAGNTITQLTLTVYRVG